MFATAQQQAAAWPVSTSRPRGILPSRATHCAQAAQRIKLSAAQQAVSATSVPAPPAELLREVQKLLELRAAESTTEDKLAAQVSAVVKLSEEAGTDRVFQSMNNGRFRGHTLQGRLAKLTHKPLSLGQLSFNQYKPGNTMVMPISSDELAGITKGPFAGYEQGYVVHFHLKLIDAGVEGVSHAIATYSQDPEDAKRLHITFEAMRLEPVVKQPGDLEKWLEALKPHNPDMDDDGVLQVKLPLPKGTLDHLLMTEQYQLVTGNLGSITLLERMAQ